MRGLNNMQDLETKLLELFEHDAQISLEKFDHVPEELTAAIEELKED